MLISLKPYLAVMTGAALGGAMRYALTSLALSRLGGAFPYGTLAANLSGCLVMGFGATLLAAHLPNNQNLRLFLLTGILGGYTTFSSFSYEVLLFAEEDEAGAGILYITATLLGCLACVWLGARLAGTFLRPTP